ADNALALWRSGNHEGRGIIVRVLATKLRAIGRADEAAEVYFEGLRTGLPIYDFRPRFDKSALATVLPKIAEALFAADKASFSDAIQRTERARFIAIAPLVDVSGQITLRGQSDRDMAAVFMIARTGEGCARQPVVMNAIRQQEPSGSSRWYAPLHGSLPG